MHRTSIGCFLQADDSREMSEVRSRLTGAAERKIYGTDEGAKVLGELRWTVVVLFSV